MPQTEDEQFFQLYFQSPGIAEAEFERDVRLSIRSFLYSASGDGRDHGARDGREVDMVPRRGGFLSRLTNPASLPHWLNEADVDFYVSEFARTGFRGGLNWYRNIDRNWELLAPVSGVQVTVPALYIAGEPRSRFGLSWDGPNHRQPVEFCTAAPENTSASRLRSLDPTGASPGGQPGCN
jgi:hypothetical protein